jgi:nucleotide-binding universal stress UspA family protein
MRTISVLSPVALGHQDARPLTPALDSLEGRRLGIRVDRAWRSFQWLAEEVAARARDRFRAADVRFFDPETRIGSPDTEREKLQRFAADVDAAIVGLGT